MAKKIIDPEKLKKQEENRIKMEAIRKKEMLESESKDMLKKKADGILPLNPTRFFAIDERVQWGNMNETYIRQSYDQGLYYLIESIKVKRNRDTEGENEIRYVPWHEIYTYGYIGTSEFAQPEEYRINYLNSSIQSLFHMVYYPGVDFNVDYQREHVWNLDDKVALIDSIFNNIDIGKFTFVQRGYHVEGKLYEILDGKQRLTALCEFHEGRFPYKGLYFSEMSFPDRHRIEGHPISWGYLQNPSRKAIFETFIKLNTTGRPMKNEDIDKVKNLLNNEK